MSHTKLEEQCNTYRELARFLAEALDALRDEFRWSSATALKAHEGLARARALGLLPEIQGGEAAQTEETRMSDPFCICPNLADNLVDDSCPVHNPKPASADAASWLLQQPSAPTSEKGDSFMVDFSKPVSADAKPRDEIAVARELLNLWMRAAGHEPRITCRCPGCVFLLRQPATGGGR